MYLKQAIIICILFLLGMDLNASAEYPKLNDDRLQISLYAEDPEQSERPDDEQRLGARKDQRQIGGKYGQQVDHAEQARGVAHRAPHADQAKDVLDGEGDRQEPLDAV